MAKKYWLVKTEPDAYSIDDLANMKNQTDHWDGIRNYQARNYMRDEMKVGDKVLFYHSSTKPTAVVGSCEVVKEAYPDHTAFDPDSKYYDSKSSPEKPAWFMVDIKLVKKFKKQVTLDEIKANPKLKDMRLVQRGNRLSVFPVEKAEFDEVVRMAK